MNNYFTIVKKCTLYLNKPVLNGLSLFLIGILLLGLLSCSSATEATSSIPDTTPPTVVTISTNQSLEIGKTGTLTFSFSEDVKEFTSDDVQFLTSGVGAEKGSFVTNSPLSYSLGVTPSTNGNLEIRIPTNSFTDLSGNKNTTNFSTSFSVKKDTTAPTLAIKSEALIEKQSASLTFTFSEVVKEFSSDDVRFLPSGIIAEKGNFVANGPLSYSLEVTPSTSGTLKIKISANSFTDLFDNENTVNFSSSLSVADTAHPTLTINSETLIDGQSAYLSFTFSEEVKEFTSDDIQFLTSGVGAEKGNFITNSPLSYSLEVTPKASGNLEIKIPANSFQDLSDNQNNQEYTPNFLVLDSTTTTHTISFKLNGAKYTSPQITTLKVVAGQNINQADLEKILSYPPTGPQPTILPITRKISHWRSEEATYDPSTSSVTNDLTLEAMWLNSCNKVETFHPANKTALQAYIDKAIADSSTTNLNHIDTSAIIYMDNLFSLKRHFNGEIGCWNTSKVISMSRMFNVVGAFNRDIGNWDVSKVTDMQYMFNGASSFNRDIGNWDVSKVTDMQYMFYYTTAFNQDIGNWDVSKVTDMQYMFFNAASFDQNLRGWPIDSLISYDRIFRFSAMENKTKKHPRFDRPPSLIISSETIVNGQSAYLSFTFTEDVTEFSLDDIQFLPTGVNADKGEFIINSKRKYFLKVTPSAVGDLKLAVPIRSFQDLSGNQNIKEFTGSFPVLPSTTTIHTISFKLNGAKYTYPIITTLKVIDGQNIDQTRLREMISYPPAGPNPSSLPIVRNLAEWRSEGVIYDPFAPVTSDLTLEAVWYNQWSRVLETFHPTNKNELKAYTDKAIADNSTTNLYHIDTSAITDMSGLFAQKSRFNGEIGSWDTSKVINMSHMFSGASTFDRVIINLNVSKVTSMEGMFSGASRIHAGIKTWDTSRVTNMSYMFSDSTSAGADIGGWNVSKVTDMNNMFAGASAFNQNISNWNVANVTDMNNMFANANAFNQNISKWNVSQVTTMNDMFANAKAFNQNIGNWNVSTVTNMQNMFSGASAFNQNIGNWNVANVTDMQSMFFFASAFDQDLSGWSVGAVTSYNNIFAGSPMDKPENADKRPPGF